MTDLELIAYPIKRMKMKLQLIGGAGGDFSGYQKTVFWDECEANTWDYYKEKTWKEMGERTKEDSFLVLREIEGDVLSLDLSVDSTSDIRRVLSTTLHMEDKEYFASTFVTIWLNRLIRFQVGLYDWEIKEYKWFLLGSFMVTQTDYSFNAQTQNLSLTLADLMASVTEERGNQIGTEVVIPVDSTMQEALQSTVERFFPFNFTDITNFDEELVPYDLEFERGVYPYEIARKIVTLYPTYEHFYTPDGIYTVQQVPTGIEDPIVLEADDIDKLIISDSGSVSPRDIKNVTEVWGRQLEGDRTADECDGTTQSGTYLLHIDEDFEVLEEGMTVSFVADVSCVSGQKIKIQETSSLPVVVIDGQGLSRAVKRGEIKKDTQYVIKYTNDVFALQGESEVHGMCFLYNEPPSEDEILDIKSKYNCNNIKIMIDRDSQFSIERIGEKIRVFSGGEYENIYTNELALERAYYENWKSARIQDTLQLEMIYVPWLDVNQKISYRSIVNGETNEYLVQSIRANTENFTMSVTMIRFYPFYPWLRKRSTWGDYKETTWGELEDLYWDEMIYIENNG